VSRARQPHRPAFRRPRGGASEQIARELRRYVSSHELRPGDRLGTEQELAAEFGVSRPTLREALRLLAGSHLIRASTGPGGGIFVASTPNEGLGRNLSDSIASMLETDAVSLDELLAARIHLEVPLAGLAAANATPDTVDALQAAMDDAAGRDPGTPEFSAADARFHRVIAAAAGNELLRGFTSWTLDVLQPSLIEAVGHLVDGEAVLEQHAVICRAIQRRRAPAAERAMRAHLDYMQALLETLEEPHH
jgi:GntR family transcriptional regulator, transcriptional repressor for pyruvate dehydrogenase complex